MTKQDNSMERDIQTITSFAFSGSKRKSIAITVTSGKGGVGKSVIALNLATAFAEQGMRTLVWDLDVNYPNLHILFGVEPDFRLSDVYANKCDVEDALFELSPNLFLLADSPALGTVRSVEVSQVGQLFHYLKKDFDVVVFDTSSGAGELALCSSLWSTLTLLLVTDEPTSLLDSYGLMKLMMAYTSPDHIRLLVNNSHADEDAVGMHEKFNLVTKKFLRCEIPLAGKVAHDSLMHSSVLQQESVIKSHPDSELARNLRAIAQRLLGEITDSVETTKDVALMS